jgi:tetratricopeptide (TPR) repeat protein
MPGDPKPPQEDTQSYKQPAPQPTQPPMNADRYPMPPRLELAIAIGILCIVLYSFQFYGTGSVLRIAAVGLLIGGAALVLGFLLGLIFGIPREAKRQAEQASAEAAAEKTAGGEDKKPLEQNSNLVDISDWLTKIVVGVGLVELKKIPSALWRMSVSLSPGLRSPDTPSYANSSAACCLAIVLFFLVAGFLFGYVWTRLPFYSALNAADRKAKADELALGAEGSRVEGRPKDAVRRANVALDLDSQNARALFTKARALNQLAQAKGKPYDKKLLQEALDCVTTVVKLLPQNGGPRYNMACYQALLGYDKEEVLKNLRIAIQNNPSLKKDARLDRDLESLRDDPAFKELVGEASLPTEPH